MVKKIVFIFSALVMIIASIGVIIAEDTVTYNTDIEPVLSSNGCTGCHTFAQSYSGLIAATSFDTQLGLPLVYTAVPDSSVLLWRLNGEKPNGDPVNSMPKGGAALSAETIALFRTWIEQGAPEDIVVDVEESKTWRQIKEQFKTE